MPIISDKQAGELLSKAHHLGDSDEVKALRAKLEKAKGALNDIKKEVNVPAQEYVPSLVNAYEIAEQALKELA